MSEENFTNDGSEVKTAFNSSLDIIQRISKLEYSLISAILEDDLSYATKLLILIHTEIEFKMNDTERDNLEKFEEELSEKLTLANSIYVHKQNNNKYYRFPEIRDLSRKMLIDLKKILNRLKYKYGLGMTDLDDPRFALMNG